MGGFLVGAEGERLDLAGVRCDGGGEAGRVLRWRGGLHLWESLRSFLRVLMWGRGGGGR